MDKKDKEIIKDAFKRISGELTALWFGIGLDQDIAETEGNHEKARADAECVKLLDSLMAYTKRVYKKIEKIED